jgi:DNA-binding NarL/FixJ family response regulator
MAATTPEQSIPGKKAILIVDDHPVIRRGLTAMIDSEPDLIVCAEAADGPAALEAIRENPPDLVIVDLALGDDDGLVLIKEIKAQHPKIPALVLSMHDEALYAERCLRAGARGYVTKQQLDDTVLVAIRCLLDGDTYMSDSLRARLAAKFTGGQTLETSSPLDALSDRQLQVFRLIGEGHTTRQIAEALNLSVKTIESHRESIKQKLTLETSAELARRATQWVETGRSG